MVHRLFLIGLLFTCMSVSTTASETSTKQADRTAVRTLKGHQAVILSVAVSPDGKTAATGSMDRNVIFWDTETGKERSRIKAADSGVSALAFSGDGTLVATGSRDKDVVFWDVRTGEERKRFPNHRSAVTSLAIHPNGKYLVFGLDNGQAGVWDIKTAKPLHPLNEHSRTITATALASNRPLAVFASQDRTLSVWDLETGRRQTVFKEHRGAVEAVAFDRSSRRIVSGSADRTAIIWDAANGRELYRLEGHDASVNFVAFAPDGLSVYTASADKMFTQWDARTGKPMVRCSTDVSTVRAAIGADAYYTVACGTEPEAVLFPTESLGFIEPRQPPPTGKGPFGRLLTGSKPILRLNPLQRPLMQKTTLSQKAPIDPLPSGPQNNVAAFYPEKPFAVTVGGDSDGAVWNLENGETAVKISFSSPLTALAVQPQGKVVAAGAGDGSLLLLNSVDGARLQAMRGHTRSVNAVAFSSNGARLISGGVDQNLVLWDVGTGKSLNVFQGHKGAINAVAITPDSSRVISVSEDKTIRLWSDENREGQILDEQASPLISLALDPGGLWFAVGERKKSITIWDLKELKPITKIDNLNEPAVALTVSPDGRILASGGVDGIVVFWDVKTWKPFLAFPQIPRETAEAMEAEAAKRAEKKQWARKNLDGVRFEPVRSIAFNKDGSRMLSSGGRDTLFWDLSKVVPPSVAAERASRETASSTPSSQKTSLASLPVGKHLRTFEEFQSPVSAAALSRDGSKLIVALSGKVVLTLNADNGKEISRFTARSAFQTIRLMPDGRTLLAGGEDGRFFSVNTISKKDLFMSKVHTDRIRCLDMTLTGTKAVTGGEDRMAVLWDPKRGEDLGRLTREHQGPVCGVSIHRDGSRALTASEDRKVILWDTKTLKPVEILRDHRGPVQAVAFSADGNRFASASSDKTVILYRTATMKELLRLQGESPFTSVQFDPSGQYVLTGDENANAVLWDADSGTPIRRFPARFKPLRDAAFSNSGKQIVVVDPKSVGLWSLDAE